MAKRPPPIRLPGERIPFLFPLYCMAYAACIEVVVRILVALSFLLDWKLKNQITTSNGCHLAVGSLLGKWQTFASHVIEWIMASLRSCLIELQTSDFSFEVLGFNPAMGWENYLKAFKIWCWNYFPLEFWSKQTTLEENPWRDNLIAAIVKTLKQP